MKLARLWLNAHSLYTNMFALEIMQELSKPLCGNEEYEISEFLIETNWR